jgi:cyclic pyranopterin phosphate synthase
VNAVTRQPHFLPVLSDRFARRIEYLRISLTDRCNYRCTYCMPEQGVELQPRANVLSFEELERLVRVFAGLGVRRIRLTGGEPTVRKGVVELVGRLAAVPGIDEIAMTTNGHLLPDLAAPLRAAGLGEVNVSIDTLDRERFRALTRRGDLDRVVAGIDAAIAAGLVVKLNAVALRGINEDELADLCRFGWERGATPRFIEHMPMSDGEIYSQARHLGAAEIRSRIGLALGAEVTSDSPDGGRPRGPARYFAVAGNRFGIISAMSEHFCSTCNRVRLTATGDLHACLAFDDAVNLRDLLRGGADDRAIATAIQGSADDKREGHQFQLTGGGAPRKHMVAIGG